jgi:hypothetical protein
MPTRSLALMPHCSLSSIATICDCWPIASQAFATCLLTSVERYRTRLNDGSGASNNQSWPMIPNFYAYFSIS